MISELAELAFGVGTAAAHLALRWAGGWGGGLVGLGPKGTGTGEQDGGKHGAPRKRICGRNSDHGAMLLPVWGNLFGLRPNAAAGERALDPGEHLRRRSAH